MKFSLKSKLLQTALIVFSVLMIFSCSSNAKKYDSKKDIVVFYTNDVHCGVDQNLGYASVVSYKKDALKETPNVTLVDIGDAIQGDVIGTVTKGDAIVKIMNNVGYDFAILGNHEFDYNMSRLSELLSKSKAQYLASNITYTGSQGNKLSKLKPYSIVDYDGVKVAFIGVSTPESIVKSTPSYFMEDGKIVYNFDSGVMLYDTVQKNVDEVRKQGVDYVILLTHLGIEEESAPNRSIDVIANTTGINVVLDGHSHSTKNEVLKNKDGKDVLYSQTGTKLKNVGKLVISPDRTIKSSLISEDKKDENASAFVKAIKDEAEKELKKVVAKSDVELSTNIGAFRGVRNREMAIGNLVADAYRGIFDADIGFANGGGIRANINKGDLTTADIIKVNPYGNMLCVAEATGQQIVDALEHSYRAVMANQNDGTNAVGEVGGFLHLSGIRCTVNTSIKSPVNVDEKGFFIGINGQRRVSNVQVQNKDGSWSNINLKKIYTVASHNYLLQEAGDGYTMFKDCNYLVDKAMIDNQVIITFINDKLGGVIPSSYTSAKGLISIK